ncbi:endolytic transglycosylase MltG [Paenibacillus brevis]|uniref:Endolytic transglycosylase MltG n=1 Tax=Paenibacillus brevis TaxID=2841508 RepID=A0ABS6FV70_9BACL|nr:endolytic transglycosylase MltG [Paenibacillus brevis]MBU5673050.1 endolytic transglycosylase MltG [Paenibacillus brevis]
MIRNRSFMLGLGAGLIAGALLLQLMLLGQGSFNKAQTREEVERAAALLDLKVVGEHEELMTKEEWKAQEQLGSELQPDRDVPSVADPDSPESPVSPSSPSTEDENDGTGSVESGLMEDLANQGSYIEYKISGGTTLSGVADGLLRAGVISDKAEFLKQANAQKINYTVRAGTYQFLAGEDYASIIKKLSPSKASNSSNN